MKRNESKALARIKRVYKSYSEWYVHKFKKLCDSDEFSNFKLCESITEFLDNSKYAKLLKKTRKPFRSKSLQAGHRQELRKQRHDAKKQIDEGLRDYESSKEVIYTCGNCVHHDGESHCDMTGDVAYPDDSTCEEFRD